MRMCVFLDNSSNFIGSEDKLRRTLEEMDKEKLQSFMQASGGDLVIWKSSSPYISHTGGVWELQIRSARYILSFLMHHTTDYMWGITFNIDSRVRRDLEFPTFDNWWHQSSNQQLVPASIKSFNYEIKDKIANSRRFFETWFIQLQKIGVDSTYSERIPVPLE